ncbi:hypothetical protein J3458_020046 [Metarhizium acridum]|uniref:uncharacterized protein n=1 Tax=Metarhizium acridum TaxID=92637 RepID=UPI001C6CA57C|nr:hypothetical protein J3458_020046 [Metarhizium acridum]
MVPWALGTMMRSNTTMTMRIQIPETNLLQIRKERPPKPPEVEGRPPKQAKLVENQKTPLRTFYLRLKGEEIGEVQIYPDAEKGAIKFKDMRMASFLGKASLPCVGDSIPFTGRKISDQPFPKARGVDGRTTRIE